MDVHRMELARRKLAQRGLTNFCCYTDPDAARPDAEDTFIDNYYRSPHLMLAANYVDRAIDGSLWENVPGTGKKILIITMPPGHWKSSEFSRKLPAYFVGHQKLLGNPYQVILTSYNADLAQANNSKVLDLMSSKLYKNVFPDVVLSKTEQNREQWALEGDSFTTCKAAGRGGGLTGYHAALAIVDDPIKDRKEANSPAVIEELWDWWRDVLRTRLLKGENSFILGIWTRWSEEDPAGRLMKQIQAGESDERVVMLRLPALAETATERLSAGKQGLPVDATDPLGREPGEALWPEMEDAAEHEATRKAFPLTFDSLYQGRPRPKGGYMVAEQNFKMLPTMPDKHCRWVWATDWALTQKEVAPKRRNNPDYTAIGLIGLWTPNGPDDARLVIGYMQRDQLEIHDAVVMVRDVVTSAGKVHPLRAGQANFEKVVVGIMRRHEAFLNFSIKNLSRSVLGGDKVVQATPWLEMAQAGQVYVVQGGWNGAFFQEAENFPNGANDDQMDVVSVGAHSLGVATIERKIQQAKVNWYG